MAKVVFLKVTAMFLVIVAGWWARRSGFLKDEFTAAMSRLVVDVAFPALVFTQLLRTVDAQALRDNWFSPLMCGLIFVLAYVAGLLLAPWFSEKPQRNTFLFLVAIANWVFLPLPIAEALYGSAGVRTVLLCNIGAQVTMWSFGVWILHGRVRSALGQLLTNTGLWATAAGIAGALFLPGLRDLETIDPARAPVGVMIPAALVQALGLLGSVTVPMSLLTIGAQLGGLIVPLHRFPKPLWGVLLARLIVAPLLAAGVGMSIVKLTHVSISEPGLMVGYLIASMPVAISCSVMAERFGGDVALAAQSIFYSTFFSLLTVPAIFAVILWFARNH